MTSSSYRILPYAIVVMFGYIGFALPLPVLPEMFLDTQRSILPESYSMAKRTFLLGLFMATYPLGQFVGAPLLGKFSDIWGRKKIILISLCGTTVGYVITAIGCTIPSIYVIFSGLLLCGFSEGNISIAQSVIADITEKEHKAFHFGWINVCVSLGFIIGPLIGGKLADPTAVSFFTFATPFWGAAIMTVLGIFVVAVASKETLRIRKKQSYLFFEPFLVIWRSPKLRTYYFANFLLALGFFSFFRFLAVYFERVFDFTISELAYLIVYDSLWITFGLFFLVRPLAKRFSSGRLLAVSSIFLGIFIILLTIPNYANALFWTIPPIGICLSIAMTNGSVLVSDSVPQDFHGSAMGSLQSVQVFAEIVTGILGGWLATSMPSLPLEIGAIMAILCGGFLLLKKKGLLVTL